MLSFGLCDQTDKSQAPCDKVCEILLIVINTSIIVISLLQKSQKKHIKNRHSDPQAKVDLYYRR
jgi:hypothetical protein